MTNDLQTVAAKLISARCKCDHQVLSRGSARAKAGWSPERRARQAALIRNWSPWRRSTGPKMDVGKSLCAMNALKHGARSQRTIREFQRIRHFLRLCARNIATLRL